LQYQKVEAGAPAAEALYARQLMESAQYGGSLVTLFLPTATSGLGVLARLRTDFDGRSGLGWEGLAQNSVVGVLSVIIALGVVMYAVSRRRGTARTPIIPDRLRHAAEATVQRVTEDGLLAALLASLAFFASAGTGMLFAFLVSEQIRAWGRYSIVVIILSMCVAGVLVTKVLAATDRRVWAPVICIAFSLIVLLDQVGSSNAVANGPLIAVQRDAASIVGTIEASAAPDCAVLSLPVVPFPENPPVVGMVDYDQLWPYMGSTRLRFSYGVIKGTPAAAFQDQFASITNAQQIATLKGAGFCGALLDTAGYADAGAAQIAALESLTGVSVVRSPAGRYAYVGLG
jgi:hypothetical protein